MRDERAYLQDVLDSIDKVARFLGKLTLEEFLGDEKTQSAVIREIEVIGEAARRLPQESRDRFTAVPWDDLIHLRNFYIHAYHGVQDERVWRVASNRLPRIRRSVERLLNDLDTASNP